MAKKKAVAKPVDPLYELKQDVLTVNHTWIDDNRNEKLTDLRDRLFVAHDQCDRIAEEEDDPHIGSYKKKIPEPLKSELNLWDNGPKECTFSFRAANLEENYEQVAKLIKEIRRPKNYSLQHLMDDVYRRS